MALPSDSDQRLRPRPAPDVVGVQQGGRTVLLDIRHGRYYGLDGVAARLWELVEQLTPVTDIVAAIATEYDAPSDSIELDVRAFLNRLESTGLVMWQ